MPELPEVEHFRRILLPLVGGGPVVLECPPPLPTKRFPSRRVVDMINRGRYAIEGALRRGKVLCVVLTREEGWREDDGEGGGDGPSTSEESGGDGYDDDDDDDAIPISGMETTIYLSLHMGMTGRISAPNRVPRLESLGRDDGYPPPHSHLVIRATNGMEVAFSDPRRFGSVLVDAGGAEDDDGWCRREECIPTFRDIAPDALEASYPYRFGGAGGTSDPDSERSTSIVQRFANRKKGIKGLLLDQRAVVSGIGNWVADELLYRSRIHPDQTYLNMTESRTLVSELHFVLSVAVACLDADDDFPRDWLFHRRWRNGGGGNATARDIHGRTITFIQSGGRSTAIVPSIQKNAARMSAPRAAKEKKVTSKVEPEEEPALKLKAVRKKKVASHAKKLRESIPKTSSNLGKKRKVGEGSTLKTISQPTRRSKRLST